MKGILMIVAVAVCLSACKVKKHIAREVYQADSVNLQAEASKSAIRADSVRLQAKEETDNDSYQIVELYDTVGRISSRVISAKLARHRKQTDSVISTSSSVQETRHEETNRLSVAMEHIESKKESKPAVSSVSWYLYVLIAGVSIGGYLAWRIRVFKRS